MIKEEYYEGYVQNLTKQTGEHNAKLIQKFLIKYEAMPSQPATKRLLLLAMRLKRVSDFVNNRPLDQLTEDDLINLNLSMRKAGILSAQDYRKTLKTFLRITDKKKYFDLLESEYLKAPIRKAKDRKLVDPNTFWNQEEIESYLQKSLDYSPRQAAWAGLWLSTGCRPGEILALKKKDIEFDGTYLIVRVPKETKTGARTIVLNGTNGKGSWTYIEPYWQTLTENQKLFDLDWSTQYKIHKKVIKKSTIGKDKDTTFYMARKMNLTKFYNTYGLAKAASMAGHTPGSKSMKHYVAMSEADLMNKDPVQITIKTCPNTSCGFENEPHLSQCLKCGAPLDKEKYSALIKKNETELKDQMKNMIYTILKEKGIQYTKGVKL